MIFFALKVFMVLVKLRTENAIVVCQNQNWDITAANNRENHISIFPFNLLN